MRLGRSWPLLVINSYKREHYRHGKQQVLQCNCAWMVCCTLPDAVGSVLHGTAAGLMCQCQCKLHSALLLSVHEKASILLYACEWRCLHQDMRTQHTIWCGTASCGLRDCCYLPNMDNVNCLVAAGTDGALHVYQHPESQGIAHNSTPTLCTGCCHEHALVSMVMHR